MKFFSNIPDLEMLNCEGLNSASSLGVDRGDRPAPDFSEARIRGDWGSGPVVDFLLKRDNGDAENNNRYTE